MGPARLACTTRKVHTNPQPQLQAILGCGRGAEAPLHHQPRTAVDRVHHTAPYSLCTKKGLATHRKPQHTAPTALRLTIRGRLYLGPLVLEGPQRSTITSYTCMEGAGECEGQSGRKVTAVCGGCAQQRRPVAGGGGVPGSSRRWQQRSMPAGVHAFPFVNAWPVMEPLTAAALRPMRAPLAHTLHAGTANALAATQRTHLRAHHATDPSNQLRMRIETRPRHVLPLPLSHANQCHAQPTPPHPGPTCLP